MVARCGDQWISEVADKPNGFQVVKAELAIARTILHPFDIA